MEFIPATIYELSVVYHLLKESAEWLKSKNLTQWSVWLNPEIAPAYLKDWIEKSLQDGEFFLLKNNDNSLYTETLYPNILGMYRLMYKDEMFWGNDSEKAGYIHSFVVRKHYKGQNLGTNILHHIKNVLKNQNIELMRLDCNASNHALCGYYEIQGFVKVGEKQMEWGINNLYEKKITT